MAQWARARVVRVAIARVHRRPPRQPRQGQQSIPPTPWDGRGPPLPRGSGGKGVFGGVGRLPSSLRAVGACAGAALVSMPAPRGLGAPATGRAAHHGGRGGRSGHSEGRGASAARVPGACAALWLGEEVAAAHLGSAARTRR